MNRKASFAALLAVVGVSIIFGMILGGRLNAPDVMKAASSVPATPAAFATPSNSGHGLALPDFSDIASETLPAVVGV